MLKLIIAAKSGRSPSRFYAVFLCLSIPTAKVITEDVRRRTISIRESHVNKRLDRRHINYFYHAFINKMTYAPNENTDLHGHPPKLIRVLALCWPQWFVMQSANKLITFGECPGHWPTVPTHMQAALSLCRAHRILGWFDHALAPLYLIPISLMTHPLTKEMKNWLRFFKNTQSLLCINGYVSWAWNTNGAYKKYHRRQKVPREHYAEYERKGWSYIQV